MTNPVIADNRPVRVNLNRGEEYHFCTCGRSRSQPFCDGSHTGTPFMPRVIVAEQDGDAFLCACKHTRNPPFCDGTHQRFGNEQVGWEGPGVETSGANTPEVRATPEEPAVELIHRMAREGLQGIGHQGPIAAMGVPRDRLPQWDDIQIMVAQLSRRPLTDDAQVTTELVIGPETRRPLTLKIPLFVSDMSFGALSEEAKVALARGAERAGTGICSGEGGMLPEEQQATSRYLYELASARFGYSEALLEKVQAFHFKAGQAAKTGTGGHLPAAKNTGKVARLRGLPEGQPAISPAAFADLHTPTDFRKFADRVRELTGGIPIGFKMSANHIERDLEFALQAGADYVILDGRGGGTGAAPLLFRDHISVPTIPALARARRYLDQRRASGRVTLVITGGLRVPSDFVKALALGADGIAIANSAIQAIGCVAARICNTNNCPAGITTQKPELRQRLDVDASAARLDRFLRTSVELMKVMARACGHARLDAFGRDDLATFDARMARLAGIEYSGFDVSSPAERQQG
jgi:glutamate synthase domain-containing protein 2/CDGSH-type Zn-finger protein